jgi:hypothetical protein
MASLDPPVPRSCRPTFLSPLPVLSFLRGSGVFLPSTEEGGRLTRFSGRIVRVSARGCAARVFRLSTCRSVCTAFQSRHWLRSGPPRTNTRPLSSGRFHRASRVSSRRNSTGRNRSPGRSGTQRTFLPSGMKRTVAGRKYTLWCR